MPRNTAQRIQGKIKQLAEDPYVSNPNVRKLTGREGSRIRVGDWRIIYELSEEELTILVMRIAPRGEVYR